jgi:hypothetical protein
MKPEILTAIIAASAALGGVILSQAITITLSFFEKRHKKQILLRQKYEEMMFHFSDSLSWIQDLHCCKTRHELFAQAQSPPSRKALSLCLLYFQDLSDTANQYIFAQQEYYRFVASSFDENLSANAGGQALFHQEGKILLDNLMKKKIVFENLIVNNSKKYIKA